MIVGPNQTYVFIRKGGEETLAMLPEVMGERVLSLYDTYGEITSTVQNLFLDDETEDDVRFEHDEPQRKKRIAILRSGEETYFLVETFRDFMHLYKSFTFDSASDPYALFNYVL